MVIKLIDSTEYHLSHHGIKGMKWGVRRTPEQLGHYRSGKNNKGSDRTGMDPMTAKAVTKTVTATAVYTALGMTPMISRAVKTYKYKKRWRPHRDDNAEALKNNRKKEYVDPETGLYLKKKDKGIEDDLTKINPNFKEGQPFNTNCTMCTAAMEMRRRGYDVAACGLVDTDLGGVKVSQSSKWFKPPTKPTTYYLLSSYSRRTMKEEVAAQGDGARGEVCVQWTLGGGHSMFYQVEKGNMVVYDGQSGKKLTDRKFNDVLNNSTKISVRRLDTLEPNMDAINAEKNKPLC